MNDSMDFKQLREGIRKAVPRYRKILESRLQRNACARMIVEARMLELQHAVDFLDSEFQWADVAGRYEIR